MTNLLAVGLSVFVITITDLESMQDADTTTLESTLPAEKPRLSLGLVGMALVLPLVAGVVLCFVTSFPVALGISAATVVVTAVLVTIDASRLGNVDFKGRPREHAGLIFVGMLLLWIVFFPFALFRRSAFASPNLGFASLFAAAFFVGVPYLSTVVMPIGLPSCASREVVQLLDQIIRGTPLGATTTSIDGHRELSYDKSANVRQGECVAHTESGDVPIKFFVEWQDRAKGMFQVRLSEPELPLCTSREVVQLLEQVIRSTPAGAAMKSIDGHRELSYDPTANVRHGECIAHTETEEIPIKFLVEWQDRSKGMFEVKIFAPQK